MDWQPIETAPKDGTEVLGWIVYSGEHDWSPEPFARASIMAWVVYSPTAQALGNKTGWDKTWIGEPTHWLPLPPPPSKRET